MLRGGDRGTAPCPPLPREAVPLDGVEASVWSYLVSSMFGNTMYYTTPYFYLLLSMTYRACKSK